jgi:hypothetical protein
VADRADVHVGLGALELFLGHCDYPSGFKLVARTGRDDLVLITGIEPATSSLPRKCSTD